MENLRVSLVACAFVTTLATSTTTAAATAHAETPPNYRPFVAGEMTAQERRVLANDPAFTGVEEKDIDPDATPPPAAERAFDDLMDKWAKAHQPPGTKLVVSTTTSGDKIVGGIVLFRDGLGNTLYQATFEPDGTTTGLVETSFSKVRKFLKQYAPEGAGEPLMVFDRTFDNTTYVSELFVRGEGGAKLRVKFNENGEPYEGVRTNTDGDRINDWHGTNPEPKYVDSGTPLTSVPIQRTATGSCPECGELVDARNDIASVMNEAAQEINGVVAEYAQLARIAQQTKTLQHNLPTLRGRYDFLKGVWDRLNVRLAAANAALTQCNLTRCWKSPAPRTALAVPNNTLTAPSNTLATGPTTATAAPGIATTGQTASTTTPAGQAASPPNATAAAPSAKQTPQPFEPSTVQPSATAFPADDSDLADILTTAQLYESLGTACMGMECPKGDCARIAEVSQLLVDLDAHLTAMLEWSKLASADAGQNFRNQAQSSIAAADQLRRTQLAQGLHQYLHNFASMLFNITSLFDGVKDWATGDGIENLSFTEVMERLDGVYEALKDLEGTIKTGADMAGDPDAPTPISDLVGEGTKGFDNTAINNWTSTISDGIGTLREIEEKGGDWRKFIKGGGLAGIGQIAGTWLTSFSEKQMKDRLAAMDGLMNDIAATQKVQGTAYQDYMRAAGRRHAIEDALEAVKAASAAFMPCAQKVCGLFTLSRPKLPDFIDVSPDGTRKIPSWGKALRYYNAAIAQINARLKPPPEIHNECPATGRTATAIGSNYPLAPRTATGLWLASDTTQWCRYGTATPVPVGSGIGAPTAASGGGGPTSGGASVVPVPVVPTNGNDNKDEPTGGATTAPPPGDQTPTGSAPPEKPERPKPPELGNAKATSAVIEAGKSVSLAAGQVVKLLTADTMTAALPGASGSAPATADTGFDQGPMQCTVGDSGTCSIDLSAAYCDESDCTVAPHFSFNPTEQASTNVALAAGTPASALPPTMLSYLTDSVILDDKVFYTLTYPPAQATAVTNALATVPQVLSVQDNLCDDKQPGPADPYLAGKGAWGQPHDDQWGIRRVGFTDGADSAWALIHSDAQLVIVAIIDTGLDWNHVDLAWDHIWHNEREIPDNGVDDDKNGYIDDLIGWDFIGNSNRPWDHDGHGTFIAGIIAATRDNGIGIAGINPRAKLMVLKALNNFGHSRRSFIAKAVKYAADNGARVINLSVGGKGVTDIERDAMEYAYRRGVTVIVAAGNEATDVADYGFAGSSQVVTVAATGLDDHHALFSNFGLQIDVAAPGVDILSLRARRTDTMLGIKDVKYQPGAAFVGKDNRYYRVSGTSFAAPIVSGIASLLIGNDPNLSPDDVRRILRQSARDIELPGVDQVTGYGIVDARAALDLLATHPKRFVDAEIRGVEVVASGAGQALRILGTTDADDFRSARIDVGAGEFPTTWRTGVATIANPVRDATLGEIAATELRGSPVWILRLVTIAADGHEREARFRLQIN